METQIPSEIRRDPLTNEWVIVAQNRSKRPKGILKNKIRKHSPIKKCPFEDPVATGHGEPLMIIKPKIKGDWSLMVIKNKYPALFPTDFKSYKIGDYKILKGSGHCEVVITRDHKKSLYQLGKNAVSEMLLAFLQRSIALSKERTTEYVMCFINYGPTAGASMTHPHGQIISLPIIPPDVSRIMEKTKWFYNQNKKCAYCEMLKWEKKENKRVVFQNDKFITIAPFISRNAYELAIYPKKHQSDFRSLKMPDLNQLAEVLYDAISRLYQELSDPDYNIMIQTVPTNDSHKYYHWHIVIYPRTELPAGFELGTGMEICGLDPTEAAFRLKQWKNKKIK
ncbi:MAG: DUF4921 family protein [Candidatus Parcubacteria bacterium]|nr:DUF4921 family protein [Candidatus Parcubacteria bacterium]